MRKILFTFIGDPFIDPQGAGSKFGSDKVAANTAALYKYVDPSKANYSGIDSKLNIDHNNEFFNQAVKYAYPELTQEDFTPGYQHNAVVGEQTTKTLGSSPVFSSAVTAPADIWSKRRHAIADFMLEQEKMKNQKGVNLEYPKYELGSGSPNVEGAINGATLGDLKNNYQAGTDQGIPMNMSTTDPNHPFYWPTQAILNTNKQRLDLSKSLDANSAEVRKTDLSSGNMFSRATQASLNMWDKFSTLPQEQQQDLFNKDKGDQYGITNSMQHWNRNMTAIPNLEGTANNFIKGIKEKAQSYVISGENGGVQEFIINQLKSQYPLDALSKDKKGNIIYDEANRDKYLTSVATNIAKNKPELFQDLSLNPDKSPSNPDAPFSIGDLKDYIKDQLGYEYTTTVHTATTPGASANAATTAVPTDIMGDITSKLSKGTPVDIGKGEQIIPGKNGMTYVDDKGNLEVIPKSNVPENINKTVEFGVKEPTKFGGIDEAAAKTNILDREDVYNTHAAKLGTGRPVVSNSKDFVGKFNSDLYEIAGKNYVPLAGAGIGINGVKNVSGSKNDDEFFFNYKDKEGVNTGTIIPSKIMESAIKEKGWFSFISPWFDKDKKVMSVSGNGDQTTLSGTYYHKEEPDRNGVVNYTIYNSATKTPYLVKDADGNKVPIVVPQNSLKNITDKPTQLINDANLKYSEHEDRILPRGVEMSKTSNLATKKPGGSSVGAVETKTGSSNITEQPRDKWADASDNDIRAAHYLVSKTPGLSIEQALLSVNNGRYGSDAAKKDKLIKIDQLMQGTSVDSLKQLYK